MLILCTLAGEEMVALRRAIWPLTRKLAVRLARKRRHGRKGLAIFEERFGIHCLMEEFLLNLNLSIPNLRNQK